MIQLLYLLTTVFATHQAFAMRTLPIVSNHSRTVITGDGKKHTKVPLPLLADCGAISTALTYKPSELHLPALTSKQWLDFQECLKEKNEFDTTQSSDQKASLPQITRAKLRKRDRLHNVLTAANYLDHAPLTQTAMTIWAEELFEAENEYSLPVELTLGIALKAIEATPLHRKLPRWIARTTSITPEATYISKHIWSCCTNNPYTQTAIGAADGTITVLDKQTDQSYYWQAHVLGISDLHFSPDGNWLFSAAKDGIIKAWDAHANFTLENIYETETFDHPYLFHVNPEGTLIAADGNNCVELFEVASGAKITLPCDPLIENGIVFNKSGSLLAAGNARQSIHIFDVATGKCIKTLATPDDEIVRLQFNQNSTQLMAGGTRGILYIWNLHDYSCSATIKAHRSTIWGIEFTPCERFLFTCSQDKTIKLWDLESKKRIKLMHHLKAIYDMRLTADLHLITGSSDGIIQSLPVKPFLDAYQNCKRFFENDITLPQAQLIQLAFETDGSDPINISLEQNAEIFNQIPPEIQTILLKRLPFEKLKPTTKKQKIVDPDYVPEEDYLYDEDFSC